MSVNIKGCSVKTPLEKLPQIIVVYIDVANGFLKNKMYAIHEEMCLGNFRLRSTKEFDVHRTIHVNKAGRKIVTLESIDVCCTAWYTIHDVSKTEFSRQVAYAKECRRFRHHGNVGLKKPMEATIQAISTMVTIVVPLADAMPYKTL